MIMDLAWLTFVLLAFTFLFLEWHAKAVFVWIVYSRRYGHGKSATRAAKHFRKNWTFLQRMLWAPVFKEDYDIIFRMMAYLSYTHFIVTVLTAICFVVMHYIMKLDDKIFLYPFIAWSIVTFVRLVYDQDYIARGRGRYWKK